MTRYYLVMPWRSPNLEDGLVRGAESLLSPGGRELSHL